MSQHDMNIANQGFPAFRADLNDALQALGSLQSGTTAPSPTFANQPWYDTTNHILKIRNEANNAWISVFTLNQTNNVLSVIALNTINEGTSASGVTIDGVLLKDNSVTATADSLISGLTVGKGGGAVSNNTVVGYQAGYSNTTGARLTAFGYLAGYANTTSAQNTFIGGYAGYSNTTGAKNTYIGDGAGVNATTGTQNTFVGVDAGISGGAGGAMTTGSKNTIIGGYTGNNGGLDIRTASNYIVLSDGDGNPRGVFDASGNLLIGSTTNVGTGDHKLSVDIGSSGRALGLSTTTTSTKILASFINGNGTVGSIQTNGTTTSYVTSSDYRLKENIAPMTNALTKVKALKPVTYNWKVDGSDGQGFIAHELAEVAPDCVSGEKDAVDAEGNPVYQGIDTSFLVATLTAAIQELNAKLEAQALEIATLKAK